MINCEKLSQLANLALPATQPAIDLAQIILNHTFPPDYIELLKCSNGLVVKYVRSLILYSTEEIEERNSTFEIKKYVPTFLLIGDDGGGRGIFLDTTSKEGRVYRLGLGDVSISDAILLAPNLATWIENHFSLKDPPKEDYPDYIDVYLVRSPTGGAKDLIRIKEVLRLSNSIGEMYRGLERIPYRLVRSVPFWKYAKLCVRYNKIDNCLGLYKVDQPDYPITIPEKLMNQSR